MTASDTSPIHSFGGRGMHHLLEALAVLGVDGEGLCRQAGVAPENAREAGRRIETRILLAVFALAEAQSGDALIGLHVAERVRFGSLSSYLIGSQNTVAEGLVIQGHVLPLLLGANAVAVRPHPRGAFIMLDAGSPAQDVRHLTEYCVASSIRLLRWLTVNAAKPDEVHFRHAGAGDAAEYERHFACPVRFNMDQNGALLAHAALAERLVSADAELAAQLKRAARAEIGSPAVPTVRDAVVRALRAARLERSSSRREVVARRLGVSGRTLQRRLEDEGTSFAGVLDETRRQMALELISDPKLSVAELGRAVGYADQFAFNKAFRRWTGRSPSAYRREVVRR